MFGGLWCLGNLIDALSILCELKKDKLGVVGRL